MAYSNGEADWRRPRPPGWALEPAPTPERESSRRLDAELRDLTERAARRQRRLTGLLSRLGPFEYRYHQVMGARYARLFELAELIDEERKRRAPEKRASDDPDATRRPTGGAAASGAAPVSGPLDQPVRRLFRKLARQIHPDLATSATERARRTELMAAANRAYADGDAEALQLLLQEWEQSPESVTGSGPEADLARLERRVTQAAKRLSAIEEELRSLVRSPMLRLYREAAATGRRGRDLLTDMGEELARLVERSERDLDLVRAGMMR